jgi:hypothetical protein
MAVLVRNHTGFPVGIPDIYGPNPTLQPGGSVIVQDLLANVQAALGNPPSTFLELSQVPDFEPGVIFPVAGGAASTALGVRAAIATALPAYTNNGLLGVLGLLTANANGALAAQDGVTLAVGDRVLLAVGAAGVDNGVYNVLSLGSASTPWQLQRAIDWATGFIHGASEIRVSEGTLWNKSRWVITTNGAMVIGTTSMAFMPAAVKGTSAAMTAGSITISNQWLAAGAVIGLTTNTVGGTQGNLKAAAASRTPGSGNGSFIITSSSGADTSTVDWDVINFP